MRILGISDSPLLNTSYGAQTSLWATSMGTRHSVLVAPKQKMIGKALSMPGYTIVPWDMKTMIEMTRKGAIEILYTHDDVHNLSGLNRESNDFVWIARVPLDVDYIDKSWMRPLSLPDVLVTESDAAVSHIKKVRKDVRRIYPHMHPEYLNRETSIKKFEWKKDNFLMTCVMRPSWRKNLPTVLVALYKLIKEERRAVNLFLHADLSDKMSTETDYALLINALDLEKHIFMPENYRYDSGYDVATMANLYQNSDVVLNASLGEGFGLVTAESMLCGTPVIVPDSTSGPELVGKDRGRIVRIEKRVDIGGLERSIPSVDSIVENVLYYMDNPDERAFHGEQGYKWANEEFRFDKITGQWLDLVDEFSIQTVIIDEDKARGANHK